MKDLRIIIVSWNNEKTLGACLGSLSRACEGLDWEAVVVDNASSDKSVEMTKEIVKHQSRISLIQNSKNHGFAKACNQGLAGFDARHVLLLNPDTECPPGSLPALVKDADAHPKAGIVGPKLLNTDGTTQAGIRRFPAVWDQVGVMLKLHNLFPGLFRRYFVADLSLDVAQDVDQVMGACFLIRREVIEQIGGLDERYFVWFEEVDYCRMVKEHGWTIRYAPSVQVTHHGGESFSHAFPLTKQRYFNQSLISYFQRWEPEWQSILLRGLAPVSLAIAWVVGSLGLAGRGSRKTLGTGVGGRGSGYGGWVLTVVVVEIISALTIFHDTANGIATIIVGVIIAWLAYKRPTLALAAIAMELLIGSQGRLLQAWGWPGILSLRMVMFGGFFIGYIANRVGANLVFAPTKSRHNGANTWKIFADHIEWILLAAVAAYGIARAILSGNNLPMMAADGNAWIFLLLIVPVLDIARREGKQLAQDVLPVLIVGPLWAAFKALGLEYLFTHGLAIVDPPSSVYLWVRRTGVGEITPLSAGLHRVFFQSFLFALPVLFLGISYYFATHERGLAHRIAVMKKLTSEKASQWWDVMLLAASVTLLLSLSRSLWIGLIAGGVVLFVIYAWKRAWKNMFRTGARLLLIAAETIALLVIFAAFPIPQPDIAGWGEAVTSRVSTNEAAAVSRWQLFPLMMDRIFEHPILGSGLGATITYQSSDPRVLANSPSGEYTTYAFEWGWLDLWLKFGILGPIVMLLLFLRLGIRIFQAESAPWIRYGLLASLIGLAATHFFTPYLNHPLGLGYLMMLEGWATINKQSA